MEYQCGKEGNKISGSLHKTRRNVRVVGCGGRRIYEDEAGQEWVKCANKWWKFPEEIEY